MTELPLNEKARKALRESQEEKALAIENKRRKALGEELLTALEDDEETDETDSEEVDSAASEAEEEPDVLLTEAGNVLVDVLLLKQRRFAANSPAKKSDNKK